MPQPEAPRSLGSERRRGSRFDVPFATSEVFDPDAFRRLTALYREISQDYRKHILQRISRLEYSDKKQRIERQQLEDWGEYFMRNVNNARDKDDFEALEECKQILLQKIDALNRPPSEEGEESRIERMRYEREDKENLDLVPIEQRIEISYKRLHKRVADELLPRVYQLRRENRSGDAQHLLDWTLVAIKDVEDTYRNTNYSSLQKLKVFAVLDQKLSEQLDTVNKSESGSIQESFPQNETAATTQKVPKKSGFWNSLVKSTKSFLLGRGFR